MPKKEITGALYFSEIEPMITGHLVIDGEHFEICGVRASRIRADIKGKQINFPKQTDLFEQKQGADNGTEAE